MFGLNIPKWSASCGAFLVVAVFGVAAAQAPSTEHGAGNGDPLVTSDARVDKLLSGMTLAEKIAVIHGEKDPPEESQGQAGYMAGDAQLGIPWLRLADGPPGTLTRQASTAPTGTMGLGATFSVEDARLRGDDWPRCRSRGSQYHFAAVHQYHARSGLVACV
jgi:beta-glucosidase